MKRNELVSALVNVLGLGPQELAEVAEVALQMGLRDLGQELLDAAYDRAEGRAVSGIAGHLAEIRQFIWTDGCNEGLTGRQKALLQIRGCEKRLR